MKKLPPEHIVPEPPKAQDLEVGQGAWVSRVHTDSEGNVYLQKTTEIFQERYESPQISKGPRVRVDRTDAGWAVKIPRRHLPMEPKGVEILRSICYVVDEIEIVD